jgi:adenylate cyclase
MDTESPPDVFLFEEFRFDRRGMSLSRRAHDGELLAVGLGTRAIDILGVLVERAGELVPKDEIMRRVWPGTIVEEANLTVQISALRRVLDQGRARGSCIQTIPGRGYRFVAPVERSIEAARSTGSPPPGGEGATELPHSDATEATETSRAIAGAARGAPVARFWRRHRVWLASGLLAGTTLVLATWLILGRVTAPGRLPPRLSIVVLPFENLSGDPKENYLADGITDDVTTDLARLPSMFVVARESAYTYQGKTIDVRKIGEEFGVRYVLEGSVRKIGETLRLNAQLIATETGAHLWADRFDQKLSDLSAGQEEIVSRIAQTLNVALVDIESARATRERPTNPDAFDLVMHARSLWAHPMGPPEHAEYRRLLEEALKLDPSSIYAMTRLAFELARGQNPGSIGEGEPDRAAKLIAEAAAINPNDVTVLDQTGTLLFRTAHYSEAVAAYQRKLDEYPHDYSSYYEIAYCLIPLGRAEEAIPKLELAMRYDPQSPWSYDRYSQMGLALVLLGKDTESIVWTQRALATIRTSFFTLRSALNFRLAEAYAGLGRLDEAHRAIAEGNRLWPYDTVRSRAPGGSSSPVLAGQIERLQAALRLAGHRDHADENADFGVPSDTELRTSYAGLTPTTAPGATTIHTAELERLLAERKPIVIDPMLYSWGRSIPGAIGLNNAGYGGNVSDSFQDRLREKIRDLTKGDLTTPIVAAGWNSERFDGRNLALRLIALGYANVYWYRGGREAWEVAGLPETQMDVQDW